jgi:hypothetical protein
MAGAHTSEKRWYRNQNPTGNVSIADQVQDSAVNVIHGLNAAESMFGEMQELFAFAGSTMQGLADQLFYEKWSVRSSPGVQAVLTVDVVAGAVTAAAISVAGTSYVDGTGYTIALTGTAGGGDGAAVLSYDVVAGVVTNIAVDAPGTTYTNGAGQPVTETPAPGNVFETEANASELGMAQDAFDAVTAMHELYQAMTNVVVAQEDRLAQLRRMS